uniref:Biotin carboxyl carrier protein of acetyl-CoA carboxylase n=1 Tax=Plocamium cartilagineum TaxID=31452 RepID=A0A1C9CHH6_PLOCA|nr:acetyl-CoA carboxylase biotin carboxyl carrier protein [Plocamium cartilagineum]AOM67844.1 acetyl-CoA carboxylase biotin carboxyl carrier protein [Plocamium cartilagineum]
MKLKIKDLKKLLSSVQENYIEQINIKNNKFELIINKTYHFIENTNFSKKNNISLLKKPNVKKIETNTKINHHIQNKVSETYSTIVSPMVGTFYRSSAPNENAFVKTYDMVQKRQTVCIIEAMKLMNEIEAEVDGQIIEILVNDGDIVDCGQALMKVKTV